MDRRAIKSRHALMNAFLYLLTRKDFEKLTVREIAEAADLNRVTFYQHFEDKYDLLEKCAQHEIDAMLEECEGDKMEDRIRLAFTYIQDHQKNFKILSHSSVGYILPHVLKETLKKRIEDDHPSSDSPSLSVQMQTEVFVCAIAGMFEWWMHVADDYDVEDAVTSYFAIRERIIK